MTDPITIEQYRAAVARDMLESALQAQVMDLAFDLGWMAYHTHDSRRSNAGWPDLALAHHGRGRFMVRELKTMKGRLSPEQRDWLAALTNAGVDAGVWRPIDMINGSIAAQLTA